MILVSFVLAPLTASLSWAGLSITRSLPLVVLVNVIAGYGFINLVDSVTHKVPKKLFFVAVLLIYFIFCFYSWDFYYNHYPRRAMVVRAWQCGNREMANYVKNNYQKKDSFYITKKNGQPYIFLLFYLNYPPDKYRKQAHLSPADNMGFGQVESFDKFNFNFHYDPKAKKTVSIGYPDDFGGLTFGSDNLKKIKINTEEVFWIVDR